MEKTIDPLNCKLTTNRQSLLALYCSNCEALITQDNKAKFYDITECSHKMCDTCYSGKGKEKPNCAFCLNFINKKLVVPNQYSTNVSSTMEFNSNDAELSKLFEYMLKPAEYFKKCATPGCTEKYLVLLCIACNDVDINSYALYCSLCAGNHETHDYYYIEAVLTKFKSIYEKRKKNLNNLKDKDIKILNKITVKIDQLTRMNNKFKDEINKYTEIAENTAEKNYTEKIKIVKNEKQIKINVINDYIAKLKNFQEKNLNNYVNDNEAILNNYTGIANLTEENISQIIQPETFIKDQIKIYNSELDKLKFQNSHNVINSRLKSTEIYESLTNSWTITETKTDFPLDN